MRFRMMLSIMKPIKPVTKNIIKNAATALFWLALWQLIAATVNKELLVPYPRAAFSALVELVKTAEFWQAVFFSLFRITVGFATGVAGGVIGALLSCKSKLFKTLFSPALHLVRAVPVASFIILALVWIKGTYLPVFISFLTVLPMIWSSVESGIENIDRSYIEAARVFRLSRGKILFSVKLPLIMPTFAAAAVNALGFAWKSGVAAEVICRPEASVGRLLQDAKLYLETPRVFALTAVVAVLSLAVEMLVRLVVGRFMNDKRY